MMKNNRNYFNILKSRARQAGDILSHPMLFMEDDRRLLSAGFPILLCFSLIFAQYFSANIKAWNETIDPAREALRNLQSSTYQVLVEQDDRVDPKTNQIRALSDVTSEGTGHLTQTEGFHTLTEQDRMEMGKPGAPGSNAQQQISKPADTLHGNGPAPDTMSSRSGTQSMSGDQTEFKIPSNYRFREDFSLRYDDTARLSIARQEIAGFRYFQHMLRQIRENFAPPGYNYAYRDMAGYVVNQPIKPQVVQVLFLLDSQGNVRDVRKVYSANQAAVDEACINALAGQNFGPPPPEVFQQGNIFGINFIFPAYFRQ